VTNQHNGVQPLTPLAASRFTVTQKNHDCSARTMPTFAALSELYDRIPA